MAGTRGTLVNSLKCTGFWWLMGIGVGFFLFLGIALAAIFNSPVILVFVIIASVLITIIAGFLIPMEIFDVGFGRAFCILVVNSILTLLISAVIFTFVFPMPKPKEGEDELNNVATAIAALLPEKYREPFLQGFNRGFQRSSAIKDGITPNVQDPLQMAQADTKSAKMQLEELESKVNQAYAQLTEKRKTLDANNKEAVHAFNLDAADYAKLKALLGDQQKEVARLKKQEEILAVQQQQVATQKASGIVMYSTSWCPHCREAEQYFAQKSIPYQEFDVEKSQEAAQEFMRLGGGGVPMIVINGEKINGFSADWVEQHLKK